MQLLFGESHEFGTHRGLSVFPGEVVSFDPSRGKVPQIGWNEVRKTARHPLWEGLPPEPDFYFVHSYHVRTSERSIVLGETVYQEAYPSFVGRSRILAVQFHPEKSQRTGLALLKNFGAL
ncbi:MAG: Imidazole glycerol phosphate synthase, glutamine amidotransferase subunit [Leptospirillum sp. Group IV 'UBA BS']|nr:MAG: Imidazole glycerol phosphate synthase, glutamine amidotransferase subunit [Leptospirillum sp. Group IV 'UBA BS']